MTETTLLRSALENILFHCEALKDMKAGAPPTSIEAIAHIASQALKGEPASDAFVSKLLRPNRLVLDVNVLNQLTTAGADQAEDSSTGPTSRDDRVRPEYLAETVLESARTAGEQRLEEQSQALRQTHASDDCDWCAGAGHDYYGEACKHCLAASTTVHSRLKVNPTPLAWRTGVVVWGDEARARAHANASNQAVEALGLIVPIVTAENHEETASSTATSRTEIAELLARRLLWIAYCWNDHNFDAPHLEARKTAQQHGIHTLDQANEWLCG